MKRNDLFPTPVWTFDQCGVGKDKILDFVNVVREEDTRGRESSNIGGWQSWDFTPPVMKENPLGELHDNIIQHAYACADDFGFQHYTLSMLNLWINVI